MTIDLKAAWINYDATTTLMSDNNSCYFNTFYSTHVAFSVLTLTGVLNSILWQSTIIAARDSLAGTRVAILALFGNQLHRECINVAKLLSSNTIILCHDSWHNIIAFVENSFAMLILVEFVWNRLLQYHKFKTLE